MMKNKDKNSSRIKHEFVTTIPENIDKDKLYISLEFGVAIHKCACGCGEEVVTPISPNGWSITYNGESITLYPSIGNWSYSCQSHYWIRDSRFVWAEPWTKELIENNRKSKKKTQKSFLQRFLGRIQN